MGSGDILISAHCQKVLFSDFDILNGDCLKALIAKLLGYAIVFGALGLKLPQIINIFGAPSSVDDLNAASMYSEVPLHITHVCYNFLQGNPFSSYGDAVAVLVQNLIIISLFWYYTKNTPSILSVISILGFFVTVAVISLKLPAEYQFLLPLCNLPLTIFSRVPQIWDNFRKKSTGPLSMITFLLVFLGSAARIFTTIQEVGLDVAMLSNYVAAMLTSGILVLQIYLYADSSKKPKSE